MSRNRVKNSQSLHWMMVVKYVLIVGLLSVLGLSYILCKNHIVQLANEVGDQEKVLASLRDQNAQLDLVINRMKSPRELQRRVADQRLVMVAELPHVRMDNSAGASFTRTASASLGTGN